MALSRLVNARKGVSSRRLRQAFPDLARHCWQARRLWAGSSFAGPVGGLPLRVLRASIAQQRRRWLTRGAISSTSSRPS